MSHKDLNPVNRKNPKRVAIVISNPVVSMTTGWPVGFWWAELSHPYFRFTELGYQAEIFSPEGGACAADARSDPEDASQWQAEDVISRGYKHDPDFMNLVQNTKTVDEISLDAFDAIMVAGGEGPMFTMEKATNLHAKFAEFFEAGKIAAALCHGVAVLRYATLPNGDRWSRAAPSPASPTSRRTSSMRRSGRPASCRGAPTSCRGASRTK